MDQSVRLARGNLEVVYWQVKGWTICESATRLQSGKKNLTSFDTVVRRGANASIF
jgi:hypothetical protein